MLSKNSTNGFICDSNDSKRIRGNDSMKYGKEASLEPNASKPPRLASIYSIKIKNYSSPQINKAAFKQVTGLHLAFNIEATKEKKIIKLMTYKE